MDEDQLWFGIRKVWSGFCIWLGSLKGFFLFEFICAHLQPILAWFTQEYYCYSLESFITPEKGIIFGDFLLDKISRV